MTFLRNFSQADSFLTFNVWAIEYPHFPLFSQRAIVSGDVTCTTLFFSVIINKYYESGLWTVVPQSVLLKANSRQTPRIFLLLTTLYLQNTTFNESTGQIRTDATSGGLVRSALNIPTDTQGVPSDVAKVQTSSHPTYTLQGLQNEIVWIGVYYTLSLHQTL